MVKFNKFNVTDKATGKKARVHYTLDCRIDGRKCVTIYAKDYSNTLDVIIPEGYENNTEIQTDYFEKGRVNLFEGHPLYATARAAIESHRAA